MSQTSLSGKTRIGFLSNPESGRNKRHFSSFRSFLQSHPQILFSEAVTPDEISHALVKFAKEGINRVVINGGDGTIQATVTALMNNHPFPDMPLLGILPAGTANLIAGDVGLGPYGIDTLNRLLLKLPELSRRSCRVRPLLRLSFADRRPPLYGMFFGAGAIYYGTQVGRQTKQSVGRFGEWGAGLILAKFLLGLATGNKKELHPVPIGLSLNGGPVVEQNFLVFFATTLERLFLGMKPFWNPEPGPMHCTGLTVPYRYLWRVLPALLRRKRHVLATQEHGYMSHNPKEILVKLSSGFALDGEVYESPPQGQQIHLESGGEVSFVQLEDL